MCIRDRLWLDLQSLLAHSPDISVAATFHCVEDVHQALRDRRPDILLIDGDFIGTGSAELISTAKNIQPTINVIVLANHIDAIQLTDSIAAGAIGYLTKTDARKNLSAHLNEFLSFRKPPFSNEALQRIIATLQQSHNNSADAALLTNREMEILTTIAKGYTYKVAADILSISANTIPSHIKSIYRKLGVNSRGEAVFQGIQKGLIHIG